MAKERTPRPGTNAAPNGYNLELVFPFSTDLDANAAAAAYHDLVSSSYLIWCPVGVVIALSDASTAPDAPPSDQSKPYAGYFATPGETYWLDFVKGSKVKTIIGGAIKTITATGVRLFALPGAQPAQAKVFINDVRIRHAPPTVPNPLP